MIHFSCKWCGKRYRAPDHRAGRADYCHACGKPVWVPQQHLRFSCAGCGKKYRTPLKYAGQTVPCRNCGHPVTAPALAAKDPPPPPLLAGSVAAPENSPFELDPQPERRIPDLDDMAFELLADVPSPPRADLGDFQLDEPLAEEQEEQAPIAAPRLPLARPYLGGEPTAPPAHAEPRPRPRAEPPRPRAEPPPAPTPERLPVHRPEEYALEAQSIEQPRPAPPETPKQPEPPKKQKGCPSCGCEQAYTLHSRSPLGIFLMIAGALGGVAAASFIQKNWVFILATLSFFGVAVAGSFLRRWTMICAKCERRIT